MQLPHRLQEVCPTRSVSTLRGSHELLTQLHPSKKQRDPRRGLQAQHMTRECLFEATLFGVDKFTPTREACIRVASQFEDRPAWQRMSEPRQSSPANQKEFKGRIQVGKVMFV